MGPGRDGCRNLCGPAGTVDRAVLRFWLTRGGPADYGEWVVQQIKGLDRMPRQRVDHGGTVYVAPDDFQKRLRRLLKESGLPRAEIARRLGTTPYTVWRWLDDGAIPQFRYQMALLELAADLGLAHLLTDWTLPEEEEEQDEPPDDTAPPRRRG